jgi:hypothetical protein
MRDGRNEARKSIDSAREGYTRCRSQRLVVGGSLGLDGAHGVGAGERRQRRSLGTLARCLLRTSRAARSSHSLADCEMLPMRKPPTGEPYAGKPPVRFGGRGGPSPFPTPIFEVRETRTLVRP